MSWRPYDPCPCDCGVIGWKLQRALSGETLAHVVGCNCIRHRNKRNRKTGKRGEYNRHKRLGGQGPTPNDEQPNTYPLWVTTQDKKGNQVPVSFTSFVTSAWYEHAMGQAKKKLAIGSEAHAALYLEPQGGGAWLLVDIAPKKKLKAIGPLGHEVGNR